MVLSPSSKPNIQYFEIQKGNAKKVYRPDYILVLAGLPVVVIDTSTMDVAEAVRRVWSVVALG